MRAHVFFFLFALLSYASTQAQAVCGFDEALKYEKIKNPEYKRALDAADAAWAQHATMIEQARRLPIVDGSDTTYEIPVVIHILHTGEELGTQNNPTDETLKDWIDYLNEVFAAEYAGFPGPGEGGTRVPLKFALAKRDPNCAPTNGIVRVNMSHIIPYANGGVQLSSNKGLPPAQLTGYSRWPGNVYYNIYVVNKINGEDGNCTNCTYTAGFAYLGLIESLIPSYDGTYILSKVAQRGRTTLPHELGHAFGLYHVFNGGDGTNCPPNTGNCLEDDDKVCDTDPTRSLLGQCPAQNTFNQCTGSLYGKNGVQHNIMNYSSCTNHFTPGQAERMLFMLKHTRPALMYSMGGVAPEEGRQSPIAAACKPNAQLNSGQYNAGPENVFFNEIQYYARGFLPNRLDPDNRFYIDHTVGCAAATHTRLEVGKAYPLTVTTATNPQRVKVYIDYNNDGAFDETNELVMNVLGTKAGDTLTKEITAPAGAVMGVPLRMRVIADFASPNITPCGDLNYGQAEDFSVTLVEEGALPMILLDFNGKVETENEGIFSWTLDQSDQETAMFHLERSSNGADFIPVSMLDRRMDEYRFRATDRVTEGGSYFYRLRMTNRDGKKMYSKVVSLNYSKFASSLKLFPNPVMNTLTVQLDRPISSIRIIDRSGRVVHQSGKTVIQTGEQKVDLKHLPNGLYLIQVTDTDGTTTNGKILKQ